MGETVPGAPPDSHIEQVRPSNAWEKTHRRREIHILRALTAPELVALKVPPLEIMLEPWLYQKGLVMVHSKRGLGKTHFTLAVADAVASGRSFLNWKAPKRRSVLFLDGEMPLQLMQRRLRDQASRQGEIPELLQIVTPDLQDQPMPDLGTNEGQIAVDRLVESCEAELIIVDNLSCLVRSGGAENESESWQFVSEWALSHRRAGRSIIFLHHSGKSGAQRGTSKREDLLDIVISLRRPADYQETDGAVFEVHFEKARSILGDDVAPVEARLQQLPDGTYDWTWRSVDLAKSNSVISLWEGGGLSLMDIARETGLNKSSVHRRLKDAMQAGKLSRAYPQNRRKPAMSATSATS